MVKSSNSLKVILEAMGSLEEKVCQVSTETDKANGKVATLEVEL